MQNLHPALYKIVSIFNYIRAVRRMEASQQCSKIYFFLKLKSINQWKPIVACSSVFLS